MKTECFKLLDGREDVTLTSYLIDDSVEMLKGGTRPAVIVCPGGAYFWCGDREGEPIALKFAGLGYHAFVLRYSLRDKCRTPQPMRDIAKAFELIGMHAKEWKVDVNQIAICGFSAGGHNCAMYANYWNSAVIKDYIANDNIVLKPAACILGYPLTDYVYMNECVRDDKAAFDFFDNSNRYFIGDDWMDKDLTYISPARLVNADTPPTFIWTTAGDNLVPCEQSSLYATALAQKKIPFELHIFQDGDHGMALCDEASAGCIDHMNSDAAIWMDLCKTWIRKYLKINFPPQPIISEAPMDPEKQRPFFYIMRNKEIYASKQDDGRGLQFLYQSDGRLESSANVVGGVEDEKIIDLLHTVEGFKTLVHSVGVSVELDDPSKEATFIFQMYGKEDALGGGTNLTCTLKADGHEERIYLSEVEWREDDYIPGQIKIEMDEPDQLGSLSVRLYLNDGYEAPEQEEDLIVDFEAENYKEMIGKSLMSLGNTERVYKALTKARNGEEVTIAFIGGSVTQGAGATPINTECYAYKAYKNFEKIAKAGDNVKFVKAGVGGTPSELGMLRFDRDVLKEGKVLPDLVIVEFAVNDDGDETKGECYESLVRKILNLPSRPGVILLFSVFADDYNLQERFSPVGIRYELPMVSVKDAVTPQFYDKNNRILTKNQYFYDIFHPTNLGHTIMADCLGNLFSEVLADVEDRKNMPKDYNPDFISEPVKGAGFETVVLMDKKETLSGTLIDEGGFVFTDKVLQLAEMDAKLDPSPQFPYNWMYDGSQNTDSTFTMKINCKKLLLIYKDSAELDAAKADVFVDGAYVREADPYVNKWLHCNPIIIINDEYSKEHVVEVKVQKQDIEKKFTILGFGVVK